MIAGCGRVKVVSRINVNTRLIRMSDFLRSLRAIRYRVKFFSEFIDTYYFPGNEMSELQGRDKVRDFRGRLVGAYFSD
jgi:hypothetical protein